MRSFSRFAPRFALIASAFAVSTWTGSSFAVGTRTFELDTLDKLSGGDLHGTAIGSDGTVRASFTVGATPLKDATTVFCGATLADGSVLLGTSPNGKILRMNGEQAELYADTKELAVTSIVQGPGGAVYAATMPDGKIYKVTKGKADLYATLPDATEVWALATDKNKTALYAAASAKSTNKNGDASTATEGRIYKVAAGSASSVFYKSDEPHLVSLAVADDGSVYAGSSGKALLYKLSGAGRGSVVYDFPGEDVKGVAIGKNGQIWAISNEYSEPPEVIRRSSAHSPPGPGSTNAPHPKPGKGTLTRFDAAGRPEKMMHHDEFHYAALAVDGEGHAHVGTGAEGRAYTVDDNHAVTLEFDGDERQVGAIGIGANGAVSYFGGSDPPVYHRVVAHGGGDATWTSKPLDAGLRARFGHLSWRATGAIEITTRSGDTQAPDATWSAWSAPIAQNGSDPSPSGRFLQVRGRWAHDPNAVLTNVTVPFVTQNLRPIVTEITATSKSTSTHEPKSGSSETVPASGAEVGKHDATVHIGWKVDNSDNDSLRYRLWFKKDGQTTWREITRDSEPLTKTEYDWDASAMPEGLYRIKVEASDELSNPPGDVQTYSLESTVVRVDNTPPVISGLAMNGRKLTARVVDGLGPVVRVELAIDGRLEWRPLPAADGIFDTADERVDADVSSIVPPGSHLVTVRAYDAAGNAALAEIETK